MRTMVKSVVLALLLSGSVLSPALAQNSRTETVKFQRGTSGTTIEGKITGDQSVRYSIGVSAGQTMDVQLDTDNTSSYFNITGPGASEALYNGSVSGNATSFVVPSSGNYIVDVYLMRNAARRGETANYDLTLYVENAARPRQGRSPPHRAPPHPSSTPARCRASAPAKHRPNTASAPRTSPSTWPSSRATATSPRAISIATAKPHSSIAGSASMAASSR